MPIMVKRHWMLLIVVSHPANLLPIIMLTAKNQVSDLVEGLQAGANDYLTKPFSKGELIARLKMHIQLSRINTALSQFVPLEFLQLLVFAHLPLCQKVCRLRKISILLMLI